MSHLFVLRSRPEYFYKCDSVVNSNVTGGEDLCQVSIFIFEVQDGYTDVSGVVWG